MTTSAASIARQSASDRIYAIGDIHGRLDLLERAIGAIWRDAAEHGPAGLTVTLGDYVDRGPQARGVLDRLTENPFPTPFVPLKGNHEALLADFLADPGTGPYWAQQGGLATLKSYGVTLGPRPREADYIDALREFRAVLPPAHGDFLRSLKTSHSRDRYFFCHAGVRPGVPLDRQEDEDLLWIRDLFLDSREDFGRIVVHGHTPVEAPEVRPNRIGIDTGAFATGRLTCVVLAGGSSRFLPV